MDEEEAEFFSPCHGCKTFFPGLHDEGKDFFFFFPVKGLSGPSGFHQKIQQMVPSLEALVLFEGSLSFFIASLLRKAGIGGKAVHVIQKAVKSFLPGGSVFENPAYFCQTENKEACQKERNQEKEEKDFRE